MGKCHICGKEVESKCEQCGEFVCENCAVPFTLQNQIDFTLCTSCGDSNNEAAADVYFSEKS